MKRLVLLALFILTSICSFSQDIQILEFKFLEMDLTANTAGTIVLDQNGNKCALIKVLSSQTDFFFDAGMLGVVKTIPKYGETWVYVPAGVKRISISHEGLESLLNQDLGMSVKAGMTYQMKIKTSHDVIMQELVFDVLPMNSIVMLESEDNHFGKRMLQLSGRKISVRIPVGNYKYTAMSKGCASEEGTFVLSESSPRKVILELHPSQDGLMQENDLRDSLSAAPISDTTITLSGISIKMIGVQGGSFSMGASSESDPEASDAEQPSHFVHLSSYRIGQAEVTQELWQAVMGRNPSMLRRMSRYPVEMVSWDDCQTFISKLNSMTGCHFRLPTEAEWEFAARGGNQSQGYKYSGSNDVDAVAWLKSNSGSFTHEVKTKNPNELGIYDMSGNVFEWCSDRYGSYTQETLVDPQGADSGSYRVTKGGGVFSESRSLRSTSRSKDVPSARFCSLGLRLAM